MSARKLLFPLVLMLMMLTLAACVIRADSLKPWPYQSEPLKEQITRQGHTVAEIRLENLVFSGPPQARVVNEQLLFYQELKLAEFRDLAARYFADAEFNGETLENRIYFTQEESCRIFYNDGRNLSIVMDNTAYFSGEPHSITYRYAYNFDALSGGLLALEDIWGEQAREKAAAEIYARIEREGRLEEYVGDLDRVLLQNLSPHHWYMDNANIYIVYDPYVIAPYAAGIVEFKLPR
jgi:hypothetical protein